MSFTSSHTRELQAEEKRCLGKLDRQARRLMQRDLRLSYSAALAQSCREFRRCYASYAGVRLQLGALGVRPLTLPGLRLGKG